MHGGVVVEMVIGSIRGVVDVLVDFIFTHFLVFFFSEEVFVVIFIGRLVGVLVKMDVAGVRVDGACMSESSKVGGMRAGFVGMFGAGTIGRRVVATAVSAHNCGAFGVEDGDLGVL